MASIIQEATIYYLVEIDECLGIRYGRKDVACSVVPPPPLSPQLMYPKEQRVKTVRGQQRPISAIV